MPGRILKLASYATMAASKERSTNLAETTVVAYNINEGLQSECKMMKLR
jgi:hypothetical protein